jgi:hypothetical protein
MPRQATQVYMEERPRSWSTPHYQGRGAPPRVTTYVPIDDQKSGLSREIFVAGLFNLSTMVLGGALTTRGGILSREGGLRFGVRGMSVDGDSDICRGRGGSGSKARPCGGSGGSGGDRSNDGRGIDS